jgi:transcriptional regulator with XRE-family HTH domain
MMNPMRHIRKNVLDMTQEEFAGLTGASQAAVSQWENDNLHPNRDVLAKIRACATERGLPWDDSWFFETPTEPTP